MLFKYINYKVLLILLTTFLVFSSRGMSQSVVTDSLVKLINPNNHDSINGNIYYDLAKKNYSSNTKKALRWAREGAKHFKNISSLDKMTRCMNLEAVCLFILDQPDESIKLHYQILKIRETLGDSDPIAETLINIGNIFYRGHDRDQALHYYLKSKELALKKNNTKLLSSIYNNLATLHKDNYYESKKKSDKDLAIKYTKIALRFKEELKTDQTMEISYILLARLYFDSEDFKSAKKYADIADKLALQNRNDETVGNCKLLLAELAIKDQKFEVAQKKLDELYKYVTKNEAFHILNTYDEEIFTIRNKIRFKQNDLTHLDTLTSDTHNALLLSRQKIREELKIKYETEKKDLDNTNLMLKTKIEKDRAEKNKIISIISILFTIISLVLLILLIKKNRSISKSKEKFQIQAKQLNDQNTLLMQSEAFKAKLFSIISHDLKSPISSLKSIISLYSEIKLTSNQLARVMDEIGQELDVTSNLLNELLFWSKAQMKTNHMTWDWIDLQNVVQKCETTLQSNIRQKKIKVHHNFPSKIMLLGDEMRCEFIIRNILHNAIKYSDYNQKIDIGFEEDNQNWIIFFKDYGIGMPKEKIDKILTKNEITKSTTGTLNEQGAGIGILLCNDFAKKLNWTLQIQSELGLGTKFSILISKNLEIIKLNGIETDEIRNLEEYKKNTELI